MPFPPWIALRYIQMFPYTIVNGLGAVVGQGSLNGPLATIDVGGLAPGAYLLRTDVGSFSRFVKQ